MPGSGRVNCFIIAPLWNSGYTGFTLSVIFSFFLSFCYSVIIQFLLNILKTNRPIETKLCVHIIIDRIYVDIVNSCFSHICNRVTAVELRQNLVFTQYLENESSESDQIMHIIIDKIYVAIVNRCFSQFATELQPLIHARIFSSIS